MHKKLKYEIGRWNKPGAKNAGNQQAGGFCSPKPTTSVVGTPSLGSLSITTLSLVPSAVSTSLELDAPTAYSTNLIWRASSSAIDPLLAASISRSYFFLAQASSSSWPIHLLACSRGRDGGISEVANKATNIMSWVGSVEGASHWGTLASRIISISARRL